MNRKANDVDLSKYIFEYYALGNVVKVSAICCLTLKEVSVVLPRTLSQDQMMSRAIQKLEYVKRNSAF